MTVLKKCACLLVAGGMMVSAGAALSATKIGVTSAVNPSAVGTAPGQGTRTLFLGKNVVFNERIKTSRGGLVQLLFLDGSAFTVGENSELVIDKYIYDPNKKTGKIAVNVVKGVFRFVGGRLSKAKGGVTIKTSTATIGIRGGVMTGDVGPRGTGSTFSFLFGDEMVVGTGCSGSELSSCTNIKRAFRNGNTIVVGPNGSLSLRPTNQQDVGTVTVALSGTAGKSGGAPASPTSTTTENSKFVANNSSNSPQQNAPPPRNAVQSTDVVEVETEVVRPEIAKGDDTRETIEEGPVTDDPAAMNLSRSLSTSGTYSVSDGPVINNAGRFGFLGGDGPMDDENLTITIADGRISFPQNDDEVLSTISAPFVVGNNVITLGDITETPINGTAQGTGDTGRVFVAPNETFFLFELENLVNTDGIRELIIAFGGVPTPASALVGDNSLRTYQLSRDFTQNSIVPFALANSVPGLNGATVTDLLVKVQNGGIIGQNVSPTSSQTVFLQSSLLINGEGGNQTSFVLLGVGSVFDNGNGADFFTDLRGSLRQFATSGSATFSGNDAVAGINGANGNVFFGPQGDFFLVGNDPKPDKLAFSIDFLNGFNSSTGLNTDIYATTHLASLSSITPVANQATRTTRSLVGFAGGIQEFAVGSPFPSVFQSVDTPGAFSLEFDAQRNTFGATFTLFDVNSTNFVGSYTFGFGSDQSGAGGASAFIDNDRYGALQNSSTTTVVFDDNTVASFPNGVSSEPETYFFGNELVPTTGFVPTAVSICACKFLEWGYWGGQVSYPDPQGTAGDTRKDFFHLGTWVAGNQTANVPTAGTATFTGHAIGNVVRDVDGQIQQFVAAGNYQQTWDFGTRTGTAQITDFAGENFGTTNLTAPITPGDFTGPVNGALTGQIAGTFVSDGGVNVAGVIGKFSVQAASDPRDFTAQGIIAAQKN